MKAAMGLFASHKAQELLQNRLLELEARCQCLERDGKSLRLEWEELYDKVRHQMSRISRRVSAEQPSSEESPPSPNTADGVPQLDPISRSIMLRRARQSPPRG